MGASHDSETPAPGRQIITACALIHRELAGVPQVFLARRAVTKKFLPNLYELPGGHIDFGEDIVEGLKREIREELGMGISVGDPFAAFTYHNHVKGSHSIEVIYFATFIGPESELRLNPGDHSDFKWVSEAELVTVTGGRSANDPEPLALRRGLKLLAGSPPRYS